MKVKAPKKNKIKKTPTGKTRKTQARKAPARKAPQRLPPGSLRNPFERTRILGPTHLKHYRIVKKIGSGSYGKVYKAVSPHDTEVAMKLVDLKDTKFDEFQKEYGLTAFLGKPV